MRVLLAASGGEGHLGPLLPLAEAAAGAGDEVVLVGPPEQEETVRATGHRYESTEAVPPDTVRAIRGAMATGTAAQRARLAEVDLFGRACTTAALPTLEAVCDRFRPQLILREPCDYASAIAAHRRGIPMAQIAISPGAADWHGLHLAAEVIEAMAPGVTAAVESSPYLSRFPEIAADFADTRPYGSAVETGVRRSEVPPLVWVTFGTVNTAFAALESTWRTVLAAVDGLPVRVIASTGRGTALEAVPTGIEVVEWVELADVLARASVVVCHGGSGTTLATLAAGVPLVVIPLLADQPTNAAMVDDLGAGISIRAEADGDTVHGLTAADVPRVRRAVQTVLTTESYAAAARRVAAQLAARPTVPLALNQLRAQVQGS